MIAQDLQDDLKKQLLAEKDRIEQDLNQVGTQKNSGEYEAQWEEYGNSEEDNAFEVDTFTNTLGVTNALEQELDAIKAALTRIEDGIYGVCEKCESTIALERLQVRPQAKYCVSCQQMMSA